MNMFRFSLISSLNLFKTNFKMTSVSDLKMKSKQASELIESLKTQIARIKEESSPAFMVQKAKNLEKENTQLKFKVEELKKELEAAESLKGPSNLSVASTKPVLSPQEVTVKVSANTSSPAAAEKKTEKTPKQPKSAPAPKKEEIAPEDINISKLDLRIGKIIQCEKHPDADSMYVEQIELGEAKPRTVCSGLVKFIPLDQMQNKLVVCVCNLKPAKLRGIMSEAMVLCASTPEKVELMIPPPGAQPGDRVIVEEFPGEPAAECNTKNKIWDLVHVDLKTNDNLIGTFKGKELVIRGKGSLKSETLKNVQIK